LGADEFPMSYWQGKVAIVTGGSRGLGRAIAAALVRRGAKVVIAARTAELLETVAEELRREGPDVLAVPADVTRQADVDALVSKTIEKFGRLDALVNNAGRSARGAAIDTLAGRQDGCTLHGRLLGHQARRERLLAAVAIGTGP
jgi:NAD(P)-dependent dehydrogenase (short-subunit alcohol dehydrogenase family)